jgi:hypothetical protein
LEGQVADYAFSFGLDKGEDIGWVRLRWRRMQDGNSAYNGMEAFGDKFDTGCDVVHV